jgi:radical SAM protein with 4Fe4S-binding SPASM domain
VFAEVTRACNIRCYHCYQPGHDAAGDELTVREWDILFGRLADAGSLYIAFSGGEPSARADFLDIAGAARSHDFAVSIISNGTLLDKNYIARLSRLGVMDVGVSFHAADPSLHDRLTGLPGSFERAFRSVLTLREAGIKVVIKHCVSSENFGQYRQLENLAGREGCVFECDSTLLPTGGSGLSQYALSVEQRRTFLKDMNSEPLAQSFDPDGTWSLHCDAGRSMCGVTAQGDIVPCILLPVRFGNVRTQNFKDIWNGSAASLFRDQENKLDDICVSCGLRTACSRCHAVAYMETGRWQGKSPGLCMQAEVLAGIGENRREGENH